MKRKEIVAFIKKNKKKNISLLRKIDDELAILATLSGDLLLYPNGRRVLIGEEFEGYLESSSSPMGKRMRVRFEE